MLETKPKFHDLPMPELCPYDLAWADKAYDLDYAHSIAECSNQGICNTKTVITKSRLSVINFFET